MEKNSKWFLVLFLQGASSGGVKRAKVESWERSVGTLGSRGALSSLVMRKKPAATVNKPTEKKSASPPTLQPGSSLSFSASSTSSRCLRKQ